MSRIIQFLREVRAELGKVAWPSRRQLVRYTGVVVAMSFFFAIFLGGIDAVLAWVINVAVN
jgi:preprotein translocase subunit SecE